MKTTFIVLFICLSLNSYCQSRNVFDSQKIVFKNDSVDSFNAQLEVKSGILPNIKDIPYRFELRFYSKSNSLNSGLVTRLYMKNDSLIREVYQYVFYHLPELKGWTLAKWRPNDKQFLIYKMQEQTASLFTNAQLSNLINSKVFGILTWQQQRNLLIKNGLSSSQIALFVGFYGFIEIKLDKKFRNLEIVTGTEAGERYPYFQETKNIINMVSSIY